jgi:hypothetical protein
MVTQAQKLSKLHFQYNKLHDFVQKIVLLKLIYD